MLLIRLSTYIQISQFQNDEHGLRPRSRTIHVFIPKLLVENPGILRRFHLEIQTLSQHSGRAGVCQPLLNLSRCELP
jgi:hypothetical protein